MSSSVFRCSAVGWLRQKFVYIVHLALVWFVAVSFFGNFSKIRNIDQWIRMWICGSVQLTNCTSVTGSNSLSLSALNTFSTFKEEHLQEQIIKMVTTPLKLLSILISSYYFKI